jgi:hypothetical protein
MEWEFFIRKAGRLEGKYGAKERKAHKNGSEYFLTADGKG